MAPASILIIGGGAVGTFFGWRLARAGHRIWLVCRSNYPVVSKHGFAIEAYGTRCAFMPEVVLPADRPLALPDPPTFILVATKAQGNREVGRFIAGEFPLPAPVCLLQNGMDIEQPFLSEGRVPHLLSGVPYVAVSQPAPGLIRHYALGQLAIGAVAEAGQPHAERLAELFNTSGVRCTVHADIREVRWQKAVWNVAFNSASVLAGGMGVRQLLGEPNSRAFLKAVMAEVVAIAAADGYPLPADYPEFALQATERMPDYVPSTALDRIKGKEMEAEPIIVNVVKLARRYKVRIPKLETVMELFAMIHSQPVRKFA